MAITNILSKSSLSGDNYKRMNVAVVILARDSLLKQSNIPTKCHQNIPRHGSYGIHMQYPKNFKEKSCHSFMLHASQPDILPNYM